MKEIVRRINYFSASFVGILGFSLAAEIIQEDDVLDKIDDLIFLLIGIIAIWWYRKKGYLESKTTGSLILIGAGLITKIGAIIIEHADKEAVGDDIGVTVGLIIAFVFVLWQTLSFQKQK